MNNFIKPFALVMALTIPAIASADIAAENVTAGKVRITYTTCGCRFELWQERA